MIVKGKGLILDVGSGIGMNYNEIIVRLLDASIKDLFAVKHGVENGIQGGYDNFKVPLNDVEVRVGYIKSRVL